MASNPHWAALSPPPRIPKLKYRTPLPPDQTSPSTPSDLPLQAEGCPVTQGSEATFASSRRQSFETTSAMSLSLPSSASTTSSEACSTEVIPSKKKKTNPVLGFFSLKEPSHAALEKYAQQQRKQATIRSPTPSSVSTGTFVGKYLPSDVPKVNSKWDGTPEVAKHRHGSSSSKPRSSLSSRGILGLRPVSEPRNEPELPAMENGTHTPVLTPIEGVEDSVSEARSTSPASSLDSADTIVRDTAEAILKKLNYSPASSPWQGDPLAVQTLDESNFERIPDSHDFLFSPSLNEETSGMDSSTAFPLGPNVAPVRSIHNFSRPITPNDSVPPVHRPATFRSTPSDSTLPTLYESSLASTESLTTIQGDSGSRSIAPSSIAPSELSKRWYQSPQERLGLGGRLRLQNVMPWDDGEGKPRKTRLSIFGLGVARG